MKYSLLIIISFINFSVTFGQNSYKSLDSSDPIEWHTDFIIYNNSKIQLGPKAFFIDGQLSDKETQKSPFVFNSINEAANHLTNGTEYEPMTLYIAPYVYWIDNPDDSEIRIKKEYDTPYGLVIKCEWLRFYGLTNNAQNVVLACNRGQTIGAVGNFTLFRFIGQGTSSENITFGNYCNVDLNYPLKPELNRKKRASAIVQAQLIHCNGDKIVARNTHFISRLNLCPFVGGKRVLFDRCHFESTDDALCGTGVYLNSTLYFYSSKPFYHTTGTGAVFINCDIKSFTNGNQYFTKANGQLTLINTRLNSKNVSYWGWRDYPPKEMRNYQYNVSHNNIKEIISKNDNYSTIILDSLPLLNAYCFKYNDRLVYNTYNLLSGNDQWDPMNIKETVINAEKENGHKYTMIPVQLKLTSSNKMLETKKDSALITATQFRFGNYPSVINNIKWWLTSEDSAFVQLKVIDKNSCLIIPDNNTNEAKDIVLKASTPSGLEAATLLKIIPSKLNTPNFIKLPKIISSKKGTLSVKYQINTNFDDQSLVSWYRCSDTKGSNPIEIAVSRFQKPLIEYELTEGDIGYYIMVSVSPKHIRCDAGIPKFDILKKTIKESDIYGDVNIIDTDFKNASTKNQEQIIPGFWTFKHYDLEDMTHLGASNRTKDAWYYGEGSGGSVNMTGLLQQGRSASLLYTPKKDKSRNMKLVLKVSPFKTAGQGFSVAPLFMDVLIKLDTKNMSGYGLRLIRTTKYGNAVDFILIKYEKGKVYEISNPVSTGSFKPLCTIIVEENNGILSVHLSTNTKYAISENQPELVKDVNISAKIEKTVFDGFGIHYNGGASTMINNIHLEWK